MKKIYLVLFGIIVVSLIVTAQLLIQIPKTITLSKEATAFYESWNVKPFYIDYELDGYYWRCLEGNENFSLPCDDLDKMEIGTLTEAERNANLDVWQVEILEEIAQHFIEGQASQKPEIIREGNITIRSER